MQPLNRFATALLLAAVVAPAVQGEVIISEIMYNPASKEGGVTPDAPPCETEWVEIYNTGDKAVSLTGYFLQDGDGKTQALPENVSIAPGEAIVLIPGNQSVEDFRAAWGDGFQVFPLEGWSTGKEGLNNLGNSPSEKNEILALCNEKAEVVDEVNFDDEGDWPSDSPDGPSITLKPDALDTAKNDDGKNWARSEPGKLEAHNAKQTPEYKPEDVGSPGKVAKE